MNVWIVTSTAWTGNEEYPEESKSVVGVFSDGKEAKAFVDFMIPRTMENWDHPRYDVEGPIELDVPIKEQINMLLYRNRELLDVPREKWQEAWFNFVYKSFTGHERPIKRRGNRKHSPIGEWGFR